MPFCCGNGGPWPWIPPVSSRPAILTGRGICPIIGPKETFLDEKIFMTVRSILRRGTAVCAAAAAGRIRLCCGSFW
ncbi:hypothetical protein SUBVAR_06808 [Subdoligranulum variabile DSM 15176]|uniref:Uncharacterized protein n=1 Tax=Subdoligranulum variabile DSM 15176 TaxID=411471 RepID=D1PQY1_9FIRM|nr:hypothetical protein SUBVAR_06808 [Subdoligranulum variabile DSM 15176]